MRMDSIWHMEKMGSTQQNILIGKYDGQRSLERLRIRWKGYVKM